MKDIVLCDIDRDTQGLAGAPDIGDSIYDKIDSADIFIADVTIINQDYAGRKTPNPNVLIELGYAIKALGSHFLVREGVWANDQFVDVNLKDGKYTVIEGSMRAVPKG